MAVDQTCKRSSKSQKSQASSLKDGLERIPQPKTAPVVGNLSSVDLEDPSGSFNKLAERYGPIYKLSIVGLDMIVLSNWKLVNESCDDSRFHKSLQGDLDELRAVVHDGLFTSKGEQEENWGIAHRILVSAFGPLAIRSMFDEMHEIASQLVLKWARQGPSTRIDIGEDFTRLTLDTVALTSMGFRFNSYYQSEMHPFITAMYEVLNEVAERGMRFLPGMFYTSEKKKYHKNIALLRSTAREVMNERKAQPASTTVPSSSNSAPKRKDLLTAMMESVDAKTGKKMTEESIIDNLITFLVAGHETTAATLNFTMYNLLKNPEKYARLQQEIDAVVGTGPIRIEHVSQLKYLDACFRETLRLSAPIWAFAREASQDEVLGGTYRVKKGQQIICLLSKSHRDPEVWGADTDDFVPERMLNGEFERIQKEFPNSWAPFGTGMRSCIGRAFAWQEMLLAYAALLQNFEFRMDDPGYVLKTQTSLTMRPKGFFVRAMPRGGLTPMQLEARLVGAVSGDGVRNGKGKRVGGKAVDGQHGGDGQNMAIYYGSNSGTCEFMARRLGADAVDRGFTAKVQSLDDAKGALPKGIPVVIVAASYEGEPTHNAVQFVKWMESMNDGASLEGVHYSVFGCGHTDWAKTYQRIPRLLNENLAKLGARRLTSLSETDAKVNDMFSDFEAWQDESLWPAIQRKLNVKINSAQDDTAAERLNITLSTPRISFLRPDVSEALVTGAWSLTAIHTRSGEQDHEEKRHLEVELPPNSTYTAGDYLAVLPRNPEAIVARVMRRLQISQDTHVSISATKSTTLPTNISLPVFELLSSYVELSQIATKKDIVTLLKLANSPSSLASAETRTTLTDLTTTSSYDTHIRTRQLSVLQVLEAHPTIQIPFNIFVSLLPPLRVRQYSISSSSLSNSSKATLTYTVLNRPSNSGVGQHVGIASSYLADLQAGDKIPISIRPATKGFRLPVQSKTTPIIMIGAGTGLAPFRAFVQERAAMREQGTELAPAVLFYGCRDPAVDDLYRDEFDTWEEMGIIKVFRAYSRQAEESEGCKYVQNRVWRERDLVAGLWKDGANVYVCGAGRIVEGVKEAFIRILQEESLKDDRTGMTMEESCTEFEKVEGNRFVKDVFD